MSRKNNIIQVFEHQTLKVDRDPKFTKPHFKALSAYGYKTKEKYYSVGNERIKFAQYVGVIQVNNLTIEILPKADNTEINDSSKERWHNALIGMLHVCKLIKLESISHAKLKLKSASILDLYYDAFLSGVEKLVKQRLIKQYKCIDENLNKVKGKIKFREHIQKNYIHKERFFLEHNIYNIDNNLNQILLKALIILSKISTSPQFNSRIKKLLLNFEDVTEKTITSSWFDSLKYNRNTERYKDSIILAKLIILKYSPDLRGGRENVLAILFDMNRLYENYVYRKLKILETNPEIPIKRVKEQNRRPFWGNNNLRADIVVECESNNYVIDTKWKILKNNKPSDEDLKQMFVYNLHYDSNLSILLYPKTTIDTYEKKPFRKDIFQDRNCQIAFTDLFNIDGSLNSNLGAQLYQELLKDEISQC